MTDVDWRRFARCADVDPDIMFPSTAAVEVTRAQAVCAGCDVTAECLADALERRDFEGVRAGVEGPARKRMAKAGQLPVPCSRCRRMFVPALAAQKRCRQCTHAAYKKNKGVRDTFDCPRCERPIQLQRGGLRPHKWHGPDGWSQCPGTGWVP